MDMGDRYPDQTRVAVGVCINWCHVLGIGLPPDEGSSMAVRDTAVFDWRQRGVAEPVLGQRGNGSVQ